MCSFPLQLAAQLVAAEPAEQSFQTCSLPLKLVAQLVAELAAQVFQRSPRSSQHLQFQRGYRVNPVGNTKPEHQQTL